MRIFDNLTQRIKTNPKRQRYIICVRVCLYVGGRMGGKVLATKNTVTRSVICVVGAGTHIEVLGEAA